MTYAKVQTPDVALALAPAVLAGLAGWRPGIIPAWVALLPIGVLVLGTLALLPHQVLVAHEGWMSARQGRQGEEFLKDLLASQGKSATSDADGELQGRIA